MTETRHLFARPSKEPPKALPVSGSPIAGAKGAYDRALMLTAIAGVTGSRHMFSAREHARISGCGSVVEGLARVRPKEVSG